MSNNVIPTISAVSFNCPHCGALADQRWFDLSATKLAAPPVRLSYSVLEGLRTRRVREEEIDSHVALINQTEQIYSGQVVIDRVGGYKNDVYDVFNVNVSRCFSCKKLGVWIADKLVYPANNYAIEPNEDLPADILKDFHEAANILENSPRGAAALLRLCIQKLCKHLGEPGDNLNEDIGRLVAKGLSPRVQRALDTVRVVGNESVHPGQIDMRDNREIALSLFRLVNIIAEKTLSEPRHIDELYEELVPEAKKAQIAKRDGA